ncbi:uncharacterized protein LOC106969696 isoform X2 [Acinonyx jubatus]|uniref:Uncharacterized protein LOC106969696 isoform X2 n=1 Tax=Acinonyx jubatus TaxID=32536 RepID=A0ABM3NU78_ACIJB|nr:uncharacterized protein LOC106969696 isoform X2 [Acinonyx jubatus]
MVAAAQAQCVLSHGASERKLFWGKCRFMTMCGNVQPKKESGHHQKPWRTDGQRQLTAIRTVPSGPSEVGAGAGKSGLGSWRALPGELGASMGLHAGLLPAPHPASEVLFPDPPKFPGSTSSHLRETSPPLPPTETSAARSSLQCVPFASCLLQSPSAGLVPSPLNYDKPGPSFISVSKPASCQPTLCKAARGIFPQMYSDHLSPVCVPGGCTLLGRDGRCSMDAEMSQRAGLSGGRCAFVLSQQPTGHDGSRGVRFCNPDTQHGPWHRLCTNTTNALKRIAADNLIQARREGRTDCTCCIRERDNRGQPVTGALWLLNLSAAPHSPGAGTWPQEHQPRKESYPDGSRDWRCDQITPVTESTDTCFVTRTPTGGPRQSGVGKAWCEESQDEGRAQALNHM